MNILYYNWNENTAADCIDAMKDLGHSVTVFQMAIQDYAADASFEHALTEKINAAQTAGNPLDCIFTFNYFPVISNVCRKMRLPYISWVYDSPHLTLEARNLSNPCNHVYLFDYELCAKYRQLGIDTVDYMPLPYYEKRIGALIRTLPSTSAADSGSQPGQGQVQASPMYLHDISFVGNLYNDQYNFFDQIQNMPPYLKGYVDAIVAAQRNVYGIDFTDLLFTEDKCNELGKYASAKLSSAYRPCEHEIFRNMIRKKITSVERPALLNALATNLKNYKPSGKPIDISLYCGKKPKNLAVNFRGYAENKNQMPEIFHRSKINLNISLRSIRSGIPLRVIEILGAGGFCMTNYQAELTEYFENGVDLVWFEDERDLIEKCAYYLDPAHEEERQQIASNGRKKAQALFDYKVLLPEILRLSDAESNSDAVT